MRKLLRSTVLWLALPPGLLVVALSLVPMSVLVVWSFWVWDPATYWMKPAFSFDAYAALFSTGRFEVLVRSTGLALLAATLSILLGFPAAYCIYFMAKGRIALLLMVLFTVPFVTSYIVRTFSWRLILGRKGVINTWLTELGLIGEPLEWLLFSDFAVEIGLLASYLPFVIFPIMLAFRRVDPMMIRSSQDLGAGFWQTLTNVVIPLAKPGLFAGFLFVFVMAIGSSAEVQLLGGAGASMVSIMINDVMRVVNFPLAFAISSTVIVLLLGLLFVGNRFLGLSRLFQDFSW